jgi:apolipoprotein N-acyltransferase
MRRGLAILSGLLLWLSFPNPFALNFQAWPGWLAWGALLPLLAAISGAPQGSGFKLGFLTGLACFLPGLFWLTNVQPLGPGAYPAWLALAAWCAFFPALFAWLTERALVAGWDLPVLWVPALWTLVELLRERLLGGFPWISLGSSQVQNLAVLPLAAALGQAGLHYAVALGNAIAFGCLIRPGWLLGLRRSGTATVMVLGLAFLAQTQRQAQQAWDASASARPGLDAAVIQGGIDLDQPWTAEYRRGLMDRYLGLSRQAIAQGAKVLVWPESAFPGFFNEDAPEARELKAFAKAQKVNVLTGSTLSDNGVYRNGVVWIDPQGDTASYGKRHLVPFGEFVPFRTIAPLLDLALARAGIVGFTPGDASRRWDLGGVSVQPIVCYESVFPDLVRQGGPVDLIALVTVDTWYGHSAGPVWHASQARLRAVENGAWVARAASTGISLFAAPDGSDQRHIGLDEAGALVQRVSAARSTPFQRWGQLPVLFACLLCLLLGWTLRKKA